MARLADAEHTEDGVEVAPAGVLGQAGARRCSFGGRRRRCEPLALAHIDGDELEGDLVLVGNFQMRAALSRAPQRRRAEVVVADEGAFARKAVLEDPRQRLRAPHTRHTHRHTQKHRRPVSSGTGTPAAGRCEAGMSLTCLAAKYWSTSTSTYMAGPMPRFCGSFGVRDSLKKPRTKHSDFLTRREASLLPSVFDSRMCAVIRCLTSL